MCGNRTAMSFENEKYYIDLIFTEKGVETNFSREEVYRMLRIVRRAERRGGWTCPEPDAGAVEADGGDSLDCYMPILRGTR